MLKYKGGVVMASIQIYEQLVEAGFTPGEARDVVAMIEEDKA